MIGRRALVEDEVFHLRRVAVHEAGHATVAQHFGVGGVIRLQPIREGAGVESFSFVGSFRPTDDYPDQHARTLIALAGIAAEAIDGSWSSVASTLIGTMLSDSDRKLAGDYTDREVAETIGLLRWLWAAVDVRARAAMEPWLPGPMVLSDVPQAPAAEPVEGPACA